MTSPGSSHIIRAVCLVGSLFVVIGANITDVLPCGCVCCMLCILLNAMIRTSTLYKNKTKQNKGRDRRKGTGGNKLMFLLFFDFFLRTCRRVVYYCINRRRDNTHTHPSEQRIIFAPVRIKRSSRPSNPSYPG